MTETRACDSGCRLRDEHLTDCPGQCRGCLPRPAIEGVLCGWCWQRLQASVVEVPATVAHLREIARLDRAPSAKPLSSDPRPPRRPDEGTVLPASWLAADELENDLVSWARLLLDEHPHGLTGPNQAPWFGDVAAWIAPHLAWCARQEWAPDMRRELGRAIATARARWPMPEDGERDRQIPGVPCPRCDQVALEYSPPTWERMPFKVSCQNEDCARVFSEGEWERFVGLLTRTGDAA